MNNVKKWLSLSLAGAMLMGALAGCGGGGSAKPVSYTHLDVYKRQGYWGRMNKLCVLYDATFHIMFRKIMGKPVRKLEFCYFIFSWHSLHSLSCIETMPPHLGQVYLAFCCSIKCSKPCA